MSTTQATTPTHKLILTDKSGHTVEVDYDATIDTPWMTKPIIGSAHWARDEAAQLLAEANGLHLLCGATFDPDPGSLTRGAVRVRNFACSDPWYEKNGNPFVHTYWQFKAFVRTVVL